MQGGHGLGLLDGPVGGRDQIKASRMDPFHLGVAVYSGKQKIPFVL